MHELIAAGELDPPTGACELCGDPHVTVEYHDEDYSEPYLWQAPALYTLCRHCHRHRLHRRFRNLLAWYAYLAHVRRGGYARDLSDQEIRAEVGEYRRSLSKGRCIELSPLRPYLQIIGAEWFAGLRLDVASLTDPAARPCRQGAQPRAAAPGRSN